MSASASSITVDASKIDELDAAICDLARKLNAETYRMLELVRDFDDRFGFAKWGYKTCAEWLHWRCQMSLSAAREKVRTAHALRRLPKLSAEFASGHISYTKVRALTRVATCGTKICCSLTRAEPRRPRSRSACGRCATSRPSRPTWRGALGSGDR